MDGERQDAGWPEGCPNCERLERELAAQREELAALREQVAAQQEQIARLTELLEESRRAGKRQAAPFGTGKSKRKPKKPGRKPGNDYGTHRRRRVPTPDEIDETYAAELPDTCPHCGGDGGYEQTRVRDQYQTEIVRKTVHRRFDVHLGRCACCGEHVQGRHPLQTSDALGRQLRNWGRTPTPRWPCSTRTSGSRTARRRS